MEDAFDLLARFPEIGSRWEFDETETKIRSFSPKAFSSYVVYYVVRPQHVFVLRVLHGSQNFSLQ